MFITPSERADIQRTNAINRARPVSSLPVHASILAKQAEIDKVFVKRSRCPHPILDNIGPRGYECRECGVVAKAPGADAKTLRRTFDIAPWDGSVYYDADNAGDQTFTLDVATGRE